MGICECERYVSAEELCNTSCLPRLPQLSAQLFPDGHLQLSLTQTDRKLWAKTIMDVIGPDIHINSIGKIHLAQFDSEGIFGWIPTNIEMINHFISELPDRSFRMKRNSDSGAVDLPRIPNPIVCLSSNDMIVFRLTINHDDRRLSHFPVYQKDHLFNSNPSWDFGAFRRLQMLIKHTNVNSTRFAHVFSETGKFVFVDNAVPQWSLVVVVSEEGTECDQRAAAVQPMTSAQLVRHGIVKQHRLNLLPDWGVIVVTLSLLMVLVVVLTTTVLILRPGKAKLVSQWRTQPRWRSLGEPFCPMECSFNDDSNVALGQGGLLSSRGVREGAEAEEPAATKGGGMSRRCDLEDFNVKTLYDKLEDQNLHLASQLARHRKDTQEFYTNMCQQTEAIKNIFENMDTKKLSLLKELFACNAVRDNASNCGEGEQNTQVAPVALLAAVLRSVEALLFRLRRESWQKQDLATLPTDASEYEHQPGDTNMCYTQLSSVNMTKTGAPLHDVVHHRSTAPCLSDHDLSKLVGISPLFKTLQEIHQSLQNMTTTEPPQHIQSDIFIQQNQIMQLIPTVLENLSPQHSTIFLFGCQVVQLLDDCRIFPPVLLLLAKSIPVFSNENLLAHCSRDFYFDATNQILYLSEAKLQHVGQFIATILQAMAYIASGSKPQRFMEALHQAISAVCFQLFNFSFKWNEAKTSDASEVQHGTLAEDFLNVCIPTEAHFTEHLLARRLQKYKYFKLEQLISNRMQTSVKESEIGLPPKGTPIQVSCIEEEIDRLNESFLELSVQLHHRALTWQKERKSSGGTEQDTPTVVQSLSRNGTMLLELKRCYVSQRLDELQTTLGHIRACQRHDSGSKPRTRGETQTDSSNAQHT
ncbi:uncharacterized protein LOC117509573 [Thalassophryne amazonica]|uniref:uncharacterized protein LOC117509573 n=1 Tax=Thalassophryne amazonica TaxID=390379 RepID=UPI0014708ADE|nr:uncharacterized protein LOC117509573 [Thalassophryne amazonica]